MRNVPILWLTLLLLSPLAMAGPCGNGTLNPGEQCDDSNTNSGDGCSSTCQTERQLSPTCGNGTQEQFEGCDDGNTSNGPSCTATCAVTSDCGNGTFEDGEMCEDGNTQDGDGCSRYCILEVLAGPNPCGNGQLNQGEQCDDSNSNSGDGCSSTCQTERQLSPTCGDGNLDQYEGCDDGNTTNGPSCTATCADTSRCGNGQFDPGEMCEDGNTQSGDGCSRYCILEVLADPCGNGQVDPGEACDDGNNNNNDQCNNNCGFNQTVEVEGKVLLDPDKPRLANLVPTAGTPQDISDFLNENFDLLDTNGPTIRIRSTTLSEFVIIKYYAKDVFPNAPANEGTVKVRFRLSGDVSNNECTGESNRLCIIGYKFRGRDPEFLDSVPGGWTDNIRVPRNSNSNDPIAILILRNEASSRKRINPNEARLETENSVGTRVDISLPGNIIVEPLRRATCKIAVSGALGPISSRSCPGNSSCTAAAVTTVNNGALNFTVSLEGLPANLSTPKTVTWTPSDHPNGASGLNNSGTWLFPPVIPDPAADVQAEVETKNGKTVHCAVKVQAEGSEFSIKARFGGDCRTFTGLRDYYHLNGNNTAPQTESLYSTLDNQAGLYFPGVQNTDGTDHRYGANVADLPSGSAIGINGPEVPFMGVMNGAMDNTGRLTIGTGGVPQLPAFAARLFTDPIVTVTPFNPQADPDSRFGAPTHWGRIELSGDPTMIGMNPTGIAAAPGDLDYVVLRLFLPMSIKLNGVEQRGLPNNLPLWSFQAEHDKMIPFMDDSCIPMFQVGAPLRQLSSLDTNPKPLPESVASRTFCFNSRPIRFGDFRTGRINFKALMVTPQHGAHSFPTDLLSDSKKPGGSCSPAIPNDTVQCWDAKFNDLPPNIGTQANDAHDDCAFMVLVQTQVVNYDRYGRPYTVTVPTWERRFRNNCPVLENPDECTGRLAIRFAGYSMLQTAGLMCVNKYHNMDPAAGPVRDLNNVAVSPTLPGEGILPYGGTDPSDGGAFGGDTPRPFADYNFGSYGAPKEGIGCIPCRFHDRQNLFATTGTIPLDAEGRVPVFTYRMGTAPRECVKNFAAGGTYMETRYFGSDQCDPTNTGNLPAGHFCTSNNIPNAACNSSNVAASANIPLCPGSGFDYDQVAFSWSPLILDTKGAEIRISRTFDDAVYFDIKGDGQKVLIDWPLNTKEAAFLVRPNSKGRVTSIRQLFGDNKNKNGFEALRPYDTNKDGVVDARDKKFGTLSLWFDRNRNGRAEKSELEKLAKAGVERIYLRYNKPSPGADVKGKTLAGLYLNKTHKKAMNILDVYFHEYWKNGLPVGWKPLKRDIASKKK